MKRKAQKPYIVAWNRPEIMLSDGSHDNEFYDHEEALSFLDDEMSKVKFEKSTAAAKAEYRQRHGFEPAIGQIQCSRELGGTISLYGVSHFYIIPSDMRCSMPYIGQS